MSQEPATDLEIQGARFQQAGALAVLVLLVIALNLAAAGMDETAISKAAAANCKLKIESLEAFAARPTPAGHQTTRFTQNEINSYLSLYLSAKYGPGLKTLFVTCEEDNRLQALAVLDFDRLGMNSSRLAIRLMADLFSGTHKLATRGALSSMGGKAYFQLEEARFDDNSLPGFLVEEIITFVGRKQHPPFDPLKPSEMPYRIDRVEVHMGCIVVHQ